MYVALVGLVSNGRKVQVGDPLPEADEWDSRFISKRVEQGRIILMPDGHKLKRIGRKWATEPIDTKQSNQSQQNRRK